MVGYIDTNLLVINTTKNIIMFEMNTSEMFINTVYMISELEIERWRFW